MSHFSVLVIGGNVEKQLAPFHEFECTGNSEYVQELDLTGKAREGYDKDTAERVKGPDGTLYSFFTPKGNWDHRFSKLCDNNPTWDKDRREKFVPEGHEEIKVPTSTVQSFAEYVEYYYGYEVVLFGEQPNLEGNHKFGYVTIDKDGNVEKVIQRTNPNAQWDWYTVGGRWSGFLKLKPEGKGSTGTPSWTVTESIAADHCDTTLKGEIDFEGMRNEAGIKAQQEYEKVEHLISVPYWRSWEEMVAKEKETGHSNTDAIRDEYWGQPQVKAIKEAQEGLNPFFDVDSFRCTKEEYVQRARNRAITTFAVIKDGVWYEKGSMGWWGMVSDEKDQDAWNQQFNDLVDGLPDDTVMTIVDCHI